MGHELKALNRRISELELRLQKLEKAFYKKPDPNDVTEKQSKFISFLLWKLKDHIVVDAIPIPANKDQAKKIIRDLLETNDKVFPEQKQVPQTPTEPYVEVLDYDPTQ